MGEDASDAYRSQDSGERPPQVGQPHRGENENEKVVIYPNGGHRVTVTYRDGKAAGIVLGNQ